MLPHHKRIRMTTSIAQLKTNLKLILNIFSNNGYCTKQLQKFEFFHA